VFVQLAAPTRSGIAKYQQLASDLERYVNRVNERFGTESWKPVILQSRTFTPEEVRAYYAMADSAVVTPLPPLHDGMNLVAKEYVAACSDGDGCLVLSLFAGAARELDGALLVNPYDTEQVADAILRAVTMPTAERRSRMTTMRERVSRSTIYDWSHKVLSDMCEARQHRGRFWPQREERDLQSGEVAG
jgi:trehalose 6-phosphate synthase